MSWSSVKRYVTTNSIVEKFKKFSYHCLCQTSLSFLWSLIARILKCLQIKNGVIVQCNLITSYLRITTGSTAPSHSSSLLIHRPKVWQHLKITCICNCQPELLYEINMPTSLCLYISGATDLSGFAKKYLNSLKFLASFPNSGNNDTWCTCLSV